MQKLRKVTFCSQGSILMRIVRLPAALVPAKYTASGQGPSFVIVDDRVLHDCC